MERKKSYIKYAPVALVRSIKETNTSDDTQKPKSIGVKAGYLLNRDERILLPYMLIYEPAHQLRQVPGVRIDTNRKLQDIE